MKLLHNWCEGLFFDWCNGDMREIACEKMHHLKLLDKPRGHIKKNLYPWIKLLNVSFDVYELPDYK